MAHTPATSDGSATTSQSYSSYFYLQHQPATCRSNGSATPPTTAFDKRPTACSTARQQQRHSARTATGTNAVDNVHANSTLRTTVNRLSTANQPAATQHSTTARFRRATDAMQQRSAHRQQRAPDARPFSVRRVHRIFNLHH